MDRKETLVRTDAATLSGSFTLAKTERTDMSYESTDELRVKREKDGVRIYIGPQPKSGAAFSLGGAGMSLSASQVELLVREIQRVAASDPPSE